MDDYILKNITSNLNMCGITVGQSNNSNLNKHSVCCERKTSFSPTEVDKFINLFSATIKLITKKGNYTNLYNLIVVSSQNMHYVSFYTQ
jgi:hypothetical protein